MGKTRMHLGAVVVAVVLFQLIATASGSEYYLTQLTMAAYYGLLVIGLCVLMGHAGQISIGHAGFFAIGGYLSALLTTVNLQSLADGPLPTMLHRLGVLSRWENLYGESLLSLAPWAAALLSLGAAAVVAFLVGVPVLRLRGHYLAMATLGFGTIIYRMVLALPWLGEADGIAEVPAFTIVPAGVLGMEALAIGGEGGQRLFNYYVAWAVLLVAFVLLLNLMSASRPGRALRALHGSEEAAEACGVQTGRAKLQVFVLSAVYAALAGVLLTHFNGGIGPNEATVMKSVRYVALVAVGGMHSLWGSLLAGVGLSFLSLRGVFGSYDDAVFGLILLAVMLFAPGGLPQLAGRLFRRRSLSGAQSQEGHDA